jgi:hypothetical protein
MARRREIAGKITVPWSRIRTGKYFHFSSNKLAPDVSYVLNVVWKAG